MPTSTFGRFRRHRYHKCFEYHFLGVSALAVIMVFMIAMLTRAKLRLSGELLAAGEGKDIARIMELHNCNSVERVRAQEEVRVHIVYCDPYDYLVTSSSSEEGWNIEKVERIYK